MVLIHHIGVPPRSWPSPCDGNRTSGERVRVLYVRDFEISDGYAANKSR